MDLAFNLLLIEFSIKPKTPVIGILVYMRREISPYLEKMINDTNRHEVIIIEGARQVGKSYLVHDVLEKLPFTCHVFDLEKDVRVRRNIDKTVDFNDFKALFSNRYGIKTGDILVIDEAQESPILANYIKCFKEDWPEKRSSRLF